LVSAKYQLKAQISAKILAYTGLFTDYRPNIGLGKISVLVADMSIQIYRYQYRQKYWPGTYIGIGIGWTHIGLSLVYGLIMHTNQHTDPPHDSYAARKTDNVESKDTVDQDNLIVISAVN
jgi:hypothetical protein